MKNPEGKPLRIVLKEWARPENVSPEFAQMYVNMLSSLAIAESNLVAAGKDSAMPHFIAIVKSLEQHMGFSFEVIEDE